MATSHMLYVNLADDDGNVYVTLVRHRFARSPYGDDCESEMIADYGQLHVEDDITPALAAALRFALDDGWSRVGNWAFVRDGWYVELERIRYPLSASRGDYNIRT